MHSLIHILMVWSVVGGGSPSSPYREWRSLGEFHKVQQYEDDPAKTSLQMCEEAAAKLGLKKENYRCVRSK